MRSTAPILLALAGLAFVDPARAEPPAVPLPTFDPSNATAYFTTGPAAEARRHFYLDEWDAAVDLFDDYLVKNPAAPDRAQATYLSAIALSKAGRFAQAAERFEALLASYPLLADHHRLYAARALLAAKQHDRAVALARSIPGDSPLAADALLAIGDAERAKGGPSLREAEAAYRKYVEGFPESWRAPEARFRLAQMIEAQLPPPAPTSKKKKKSPPAKPSARGLAARSEYRFIYVHFPTSSWATEARARLTALDPAGADLDAQDHLARGLALSDEMRNEPSEAELAAALATHALTATQQCSAAYNLAQSVFKQRNRPRAAPLFDAAAALCEKAPPSEATADLHAKSLYQGARCHAAKHEPAAALRLFARIEAEHPAHSYADDSRVREAEILDDLADKIPPAATPLAKSEKAAVKSVAEIATMLDAAPPVALDPAMLRASREALLAEVAERYPSGDMGGESLFRLAFRAFEEQRWDDARRLLERELAIHPREEGWWEAGRTLYWLGRIAARAGDDKLAQQRFAECARAYPLSYYALQALNRLREKSPADEQKLVAELSGPPARAEELAWHLPPDALYGNAAFLRGVELARLGQGAEARRELAAAGIHGEKKGTKVDDPVRANELWAAAVLYDRAGEWALSHAIPRHVLTDYERGWPTGDNRKRWLISYPRGYQDLVVDNAGKNGQPAALQFAIIREESAFDPLDESFANAVGLTQLTQPPAKRFAEGLPYTREALHDPVINITIGARELGDVWKRAAGLAPFAIAAYNAGEGAVRRWQKATPRGCDLDEWVERIPYDETRLYTKRVMSSYFAYHFLYQAGDPVPLLGPTLPSF